MYIIYVIVYLTREHIIIILIIIVNTFINESTY